MATLAEIDRNFKYHEPTPEKKLRHDRVRQAAADLAREISHEVPDGREKSLALTKIEEAMMWANAGIARNG